LESGGYKVIEAKNGKEAIAIAAAHRGQIDLLVTDMVMPGITGQELAVRLQQEHSGPPDQALQPRRHPAHRSRNPSSPQETLSDCFVAAAFPQHGRSRPILAFLKG
jgi:CheY-like chemotaxis protein